MTAPTIEDILKRVDTVRWRVSHDIFAQLEQEAQREAARLVVEVVVVDFADPKNLYAQDYAARQSVLKKYKNHKVVWFHKNVEQATPDMLCAARADAQFAGWDERGTGDHRIITAFDYTNDYSAVIASSYENIFGCFKGSERGMIEHKTVYDIIDLVRDTVRDEQRVCVLNLVGESGTGKTRILRHAAYRLRKMHVVYAGYATMQEYGGGRIGEMTCDMKSRAPQALLLDEAGLVRPELHMALLQAYRAIVYGSHRALPFPEITRRFDLGKPE